MFFYLFIKAAHLKAMYFTQQTYYFLNHWEFLLIFGLPIETNSAEGKVLKN